MTLSDFHFSCSQAFLPSHCFNLRCFTIYLPESSPLTSYALRLLGRVHTWTDFLLSPFNLIFKSCINSFVFLAWKVIFSNFQYCCIFALFYIQIAISLGICNMVLYTHTSFSSSPGNLMNSLLKWILVRVTDLLKISWCSKVMHLIVFLVCENLLTYLVMKQQTNNIWADIYLVKLNMHLAP